MAKSRKKQSDSGCATLIGVFLIIGALSALFDYIKQHPIIIIVGIIAVIIIIVLVVSLSNSGPVAKGDVSCADNMSGLEFEAWCAGVLRRNGFYNVSVTKGSGDQGVDIIAWRNNEKYAIQCKRYTNRVGNKPVQEVYTGMTIYGCSRAIVITNSFFTQGAIDAARATGVELWDRNVLGRLCS